MDSAFTLLSITKIPTIFIFIFFKKKLQRSVEGTACALCILWTSDHNRHRHRTLPLHICHFRVRNGAAKEWQRQSNGKKWKMIICHNHFAFQKKQRFYFFFFASDDHHKANNRILWCFWTWFRLFMVLQISPYTIAYIYFYFKKNLRYLPMSMLLLSLSRSHCFFFKYTFRTYGFVEWWILKSLIKIRFLFLWVYFLHRFYFSNKK